ncbi:S10 family peptidase [Psychroflexus salis]|uniref:Carboxypeptidase n=1 Tax=Psychroflexus salis TaxID=1526574 RepID=A0A917E7N6_9FLAO|nr:carboxypeptidase [Psychroflexus salis]GGE08809.1 carboxypeptidase [Psychroflexus salis]
MKISFAFILLLLSLNINSQILDFDPEKPSITQHKVKINGKTIDYTAEVGMQEVYNNNDEAFAYLLYTYYTRKDKKEDANRPLVVSFNGGPGSASVWMHLAYTGPRILNISDEGFPLQPYGVKENPHSILDIADIVYVNPVNTGYSRPLKDKEGKFDKNEFFGVNEDITYLAKWINDFVSRKDKWRNPKYLIGESYGTTRVSGLANRLQNNHWMYINGVILVSPTELGIERNGPVEVANRLPYFAAAAWYHNQLDSKYQNMPIQEYLDEVENFTINELTPAMVKGGFLKEDVRKQMAMQMEEYSSITAELFLQHNLELPYNYFWKELLRDEGFTVGRLDSRYKGLDEKDAGGRPDYNAELTSWLHSFTPAVNHYFKHDLEFETRNAYNMFGNVYPWDRSKNNNTGKQLRQAMAQNPSMQVMIQAGYFDGATTYFNAKYTMWHIDESGKLKDRMHFKTYESGHMMYLRKEDLKSANEDVREFILNTIPKEGEAIKY